MLKFYTFPHDSAKEKNPVINMYILQKTLSFMEISEITKSG